MKKAIFAGSFDPITKGHKEIIQKASLFFDKVYVLVAENKDKKYLLSKNERVELTKQTCFAFKNVEVVLLENSFVVDFAKNNGIQYLVRGLRNASDFEYEKKINQINKKIDSQIETVFFLASSENDYVSSSMVKSLMGVSNWEQPASHMIEAHVLEALKQQSFKKLKNTWMSLTGQNNLSEKWWKIIQEKHSESHRHYHNLMHLNNLFYEMEKVEKEISLSSLDKAVLKYSIFFHDIVYDPTQRDNEEKSLELFKDFAQDLGLFEHIVQVVEDSILATKNHSNKPKYDISNLFLDLDLSILASEPVEFEEYEKNIRKEYSFVSEEDYNLARRNIMQKLLKPYKTSFGVKHYQEKSYLNLAKYIAN